MHPLPRTLVAQPAGYSRIAPKFAGVVLEAYPRGNEYDVARGLRATINGTLTRGASTAGVGFVGGTDTDYVNGTTTGTDEFSILCTLRAGSVAATSNCILNADNGLDAAQRGLILRIRNGLLEFYRYSTGNVQTLLTIAVPDNTTLTLLAWSKGTSCGLETTLGPASGTISTPVTTWSIQGQWFARTSAYTSSPHGALQLKFGARASFKSAFTAAQRASLVRNPYQIYQPVPLRVFAPAAATPSSNNAGLTALMFRYFRRK